MQEEYEPLIRVMALHAFVYCPRLFYFEEVEEIRIADSAIYEGRTLHELLKQEEEESGEWTSLEMSSSKLGLIGKVDCLRRRNGEIIPYEHKKGKPLRKGKKCFPWPADAVQVSAYGMLLEEETGNEVHEGRIRYHGENITVSVPLDSETRRKVFEAVAKARELRESIERPPITKNDRLCLRCSLSAVCLPEEERLVEDTTWEPIRLFPADRERTTLHVIEPFARISCSGKSLKIEKGKDDKLKVPIHEVDSLVLHGSPQLTTQAIHLCAKHDVAVHWMSGAGYYIAGISLGSGKVHRRIRQYKALSNNDTCLKLARKLTMAKVEGALRYILRATRGKDERKKALGDAIEKMRSSLKSIAKANSADQLRGFEGMAGRAYFSAMPHLLKRDIPESMRIEGRNRRPPKDRFNALLGFGYSLLYRAVFQAITAVGLEPSLGFFHQPRSSAHPLVLDLMELFRVPLWDIVLIGSVNRKQWNPNTDFDVTKGRVWLSLKGRKKAIELFEKRLDQTWKHPVVDYSLSYTRLIELEVRLLEKEWSGRPGLFARMRLR